MSVSPTVTTGDVIGFAEFLDTLGYSDDDLLSLVYFNPAGVVHTAVMPPGEAIASAPQLPPGANCFVGVNPISGPARTNAGRGTEADVTRLAALVADLDVKPGGCPSIDVARAIIAEVGIILGTRPSVIVLSGNGLHPYWPIADGHITNGDIADARALARRFGRLVALVAERHNVRVDSVFDLARIMRLPGSYNTKSTNNDGPKLVVAHPDTGGPLVMAEADERLTEVGICEEDDDHAPASREIISPPTDWPWAQRTCQYVLKMIDGWSTDTPTARNPWFFSNRIRLESARRMGCVSERDYQRAGEILAARLAELVATTEPRRQLKRFEVPGAFQRAIVMAAAKTDTELQRELGDHTHADWFKEIGGPVGVNGGNPGGARGMAPVKLIRLANVAPERVSWLWPGYIPRGKLVTLDGDPGLGKSTLAMSISAPVTTGGVWPDGSVCEHPGGVLIMSAEDGLADTVRPRADAADADVTKVYAIEGVPIVSGNGERTLRPPTIADIHALEIAILATSARLLVVDVVMAYLPTGTDSHKDQDIRQLLSRLAAVADRTGCTVLLIRHLNKAAGRDPLYRGGGSIGIVGAARAGLLVARDPDDPDRRVLASIKSNLGAAPESLAYRLVDAPEHGCARVQWEGSTTHDARTLLAEPTSRDEPGNPAKAFVVDYLMTNGGEISAADVLKAGRAAGFSDQELKDARRRCSKPKISSRKASMGAGWVWAIDPDEGGTVRGGVEGGVEGGEGGVTQRVPPLPPSADGSPSSVTPPGAPTADTPGIGERAEQIVAKHNGQHPASVCDMCGMALEAPESIVRGRCRECYLIAIGARGPGDEPTPALDERKI